MKTKKVKIEDDDMHLNEKILKEFAKHIEESINEVLIKNIKKDVRLELLTTLLSFSSQVSQDLEIGLEEFVDMTSHFYQDTMDIEDEHNCEDCATHKKDKAN